MAADITRAEPRVISGPAQEIHMTGTMNAFAGNWAP